MKRIIVNSISLVILIFSIVHIHTAYANRTTHEVGIKLPAKIQNIKLISSNIQPVQAAPAVQVDPTPVISSNASVTAPTDGTSLGTWLLALRTCESGGNYAINTGNGYFGAYQFSSATWDSLNTGYVRADLAPPSVQDSAIVTNTNRASGGLATQNPGCYAKEGLSAFPPA